MNGSRFFKEDSFKETPIGRIPKDWQVARIKELGELQYGYTTSATQENTGIKFLRITDINDAGIIRWELVPHCRIEVGKFDKYALQKGNLLFARIGATAGKTTYIDQDVHGIFASYLIRLKTTKKSVHPKFVFYFTKSTLYWKQALRQREGQLKKGINATMLSKFRISIPSLKEQEKIVGVLSVVDEAILKVDEVIAKTERLKKGLMQQLLTRGIGHKEYKHNKELGYEIPKDWNVAKLEDVLDECYRYPTYYGIEYVDIGVPEIRGELLLDNGHIETNRKMIRYIAEETAEKFPRVRVVEQDIVFSVRGTMGKVGLVPKELDGAVVTANLMRLSPNRQEVSPKWLLYYLLSAKFQGRLNAFSSSTTIKTIQAPVLKSIYLPLPSLQEQEKIAEILATIDKKLGIEKNEKSKLERVKLGLMDLLLTGKVRVKVD